MKPKWICRRTSASMVDRICPRRSAEAHKGDFGRVLIIGGAEGYTGAPYFAAQAALRAGSGLVYVAVPRVIYPIVASKLHEQMVYPLHDHEGKISLQALPQIFEKMKIADVCVLGPGLGAGKEQEELVAEILLNCTCPLILDADGINAVSGHMDILREAACPVILTPHEGEFRRMTDAWESDRVTGAIAFAQMTGTIIVRKGHVTVITDGVNTYLNRTGNPGMATGGSGDALAGLIASLVGQGATPLMGAAAAAWLHGKAGDLAADMYGEYAMTPSDLIAQLSRLLP